MNIDQFKYNKFSFNRDKIQLKLLLTVPNVTQNTKSKYKSFSLLLIFYCYKRGVSYTKLTNLKTKQYI